MISLYENRFLPEGNIDDERSSDVEVEDYAQRLVLCVAVCDQGKEKSFGWH